MENSGRRSLTEVTANLERAKLTQKDMQPLAQTLYFHPQTNDDLILIEVDSHLMEEAKTSGLTIRGDPDDELVLCTGTKTYGVRETEISNSLLVVPNMRTASKGNALTAEMAHDSLGVQSLQVKNTFHTYWEPRPIRPSARKLHSLLKPSEFRGVELECEVQTSTLLTWNDLLNKVQASEEELKQMIQTLPIARLDDHFRLLGFEYHFRVLEFILTSIESNSMSLDKIDCALVAEEVSELEPKAITEAVLSWYVKDDALLKHKVSRTQAEALLRSGEAFNLDQFLATWQQSLPEGLSTDVSYLYGIAYVDEDRQKPTIHYLSEWDIPEAESARFNTLLRLKTCWTFEEIEPFIRDLSVKSINSLLLKYARSFRKDGQLRYSKK